MSRTRGIPTSRRHKSSGQADVTPFGIRRDLLLGKYGSAESRKEYARVLAEWEAASRCLAYWRHAERYYVKDGKRTSETALTHRFCYRAPVVASTGRYRHRVEGNTKRKTIVA